MTDTTPTQTPPEPDPNTPPELTEADLAIMNRINKLEEDNKNLKSKVALYEALKPLEKDNTPTPEKKDPVDEVMKKLERMGWQ